MPLVIEIRKLTRKKEGHDIAIPPLDPERFDAPFGFAISTDCDHRFLISYRL